jgi:hypothetical protein
MTTTRGRVTVQLQTFDADGAMTTLETTGDTEYLATVAMIGKLLRLYGPEIEATIGDLRRLAAWFRAALALTEPTAAPADAEAVPA